MLDGKRIAILAEEDFEDFEFMESSRALREVGARVIVVGSGSRETYNGRRGKVTVRVDATADQICPADFDAVIIPGGYAPDNMRMYPTMIDLVKIAYGMGKVIAAICHGPQLLISAGMIKGRKVTSWPSLAVDLRNAGADWVDEPVVQDDNLITSRKCSDLPRFNRAIILALKTEDGLRTWLD